MKLLFDQNLSHKLIARLGNLFVGSLHVRDLGMVAADDRVVWDYARAGGFTNASKDGDFHQLGLLRGSPPKVVWLRVGNASTDEIAALMQARSLTIEAFIKGEGAVLVIDP